MLEQILKSKEVAAHVVEHGIEHHVPAGEPQIW